MTGLVEGFAGPIGWKLCPCNVIVEGTSDVTIINRAVQLYAERFSVELLGAELSILHAGYVDDGGVDGVNRRLNAARQIADVDRDKDGALRYRFVGLFDNDRAGRRAIVNACEFDRRLRVCGDLFLLYPIMPLASGMGHVALAEKTKRENALFNGLDWEIEDLASEEFLSEFENKQPRAVSRIVDCGGRRHRDFTRAGKYHLHRYIEESAQLEDLVEVIKLIRALRDYFNLKIDHIQC